MTYLPAQPIVQTLSETLDYGALFEIIKTEMQKPRLLLETFVMEVAEIIYKRFRVIRTIEISLEKIQVPLSGFSGSAVVSFTKNYET